MSFDVSVFFSRLPEDFAPKVQASLDELGVSGTFLAPPDWQEQGLWYLLDEPDQVPEDALLIQIEPRDPESDQAVLAADEIALLGDSRYKALVSTRISAGTTALMLAGSIAKATNGIVFDCQGAAFEEAFDADLAMYRGKRDEAGNPGLAERGVYPADLAWRVAAAASAYESRSRARAQPSSEPPSGDAEFPGTAEASANTTSPVWGKSRSSLWTILLVAGFFLWLLNKMRQAGWF